MTASPSLRRPGPEVGLDTLRRAGPRRVGLADRRFMASLDAASQLHLLASLVVMPSCGWASR